MAKTTPISWCDSTANVHQGCMGCELWDSPAAIFRHLDTAITAHDSNWPEGKSEDEFTQLCAEAYDKINKPLEGHIRTPTTSNIWRMRKRFLEMVPDAAQGDALTALEKSCSCYAGNIHAMMKSQRIDQPEYNGMKGFAFTFDRQIEKPGQLWDAIKYPDLLGTTNPLTPWMDGLARSIFVDDMSDIFAEDLGNTPQEKKSAQEKRFQFVLDEIIAPMTSEKGKRHLYFILTKRPHIATQFSRKHGPFPPNCVVMTSITCWDNRNQKRLADLKTVHAEMLGISFEPLRGPVPIDKLDLTGISWAIAGGESHQKDFKSCSAFHCEWAMDLLKACRKKGIPFFMKQLGGNAFLNGEPHPTPHAKGDGGDHRDWPEELKVKEMPQQFHDYRADERSLSHGARPVDKSQLPKGLKKMKKLPKNFTEEDKEVFKVLHKKVLKAAEQFVEGGLALEEIKRTKLYKIDGHKTYQEYCKSVQEISAQYANRLILAGETYRKLEPLLREKQIEPPKVESQLGALAKIGNIEAAAEVYCELLESEQDAKKITAAKIIDVAEGKMPSAPRPETPSQRMEKALALLEELRDQIEHSPETTKMFSKMKRLLTPSKPSKKK
jgi:protein gp37